MSRCLVVLLSLLVCTPAWAQTNLAAGKPVRFANVPDYRLTAKGDTDTTDLTDGELSSRDDDKLWFDSAAVGYSYGGYAQLAVDLGEVEAIDEVAIRLQGGAPQGGIAVPVWMDVVVSDDGETWHRVAGYSAFVEGDFERVGLPRNEGEAWVHRLRFTDLNTRGRHVGLAFYGAGLSVMDEMWVLEGSHPTRSARFDADARVPMAVDGVLPYFHKPKLLVTTNIATPTPIGVIGTPDTLGREVRVQLDLPRGMELIGGRIGGVDAAEMQSETVSVGGRQMTRYTFRATPEETAKVWGRVYIDAEPWRPGQQGALRYRVDDGDWYEQPVEAIAIEPVQAPRRLCVGLSWWGLGSTASWPDAIDAFKTLGLNTVPMFAHWTDPDDTELWSLIDTFREAGFWVMNTDSPLHRMQQRHGSHDEIYCQFEDGSHSSRLCPSYRGQYFEDEVKRLATQALRCKARFHNWDIEAWSWRGPTDSRDCTRCQQDKQNSDIDDWEQWQQVQGVEMFTAMATAVGEALRAEGVTEFDLGMYDLRPGEPYQFTWNFNKLYPEHVTNSQVSTYTPYYPYHLEVIGDEVREDREQLPETDQMPWLTPGDAGVFPRRVFKYALLEVFANGSRGVNFWSGRVWDAEGLAAYADAIRIVRQVEDVVVDGELLEDAEATDGVRVRGMRHEDEMFVLVTDYHDDAPARVRVKLNISRPSRVIDLETGKPVANLTPANNTMQVRFDGELARAYHVVPR